MRHDFPKKFSEDSHNGKKGRFPRGSKKLCIEDGDGHSSTIRGMKRVHQFANKFGIRDGKGMDLALMKRFLMRRRGQPWDQVYSEICTQTDERTHTGHHFKEWLDYEVNQNCTIDEHGDIWEPAGRYRLSNDFYVHPDTRTLEYAPTIRYSSRKPEELKVFEVDGKYYHKHDNIWYRVKMEKVPKEENSMYKGRWAQYHRPWMLSDVFGLNQDYNGGSYLYSIIGEMIEKYGKDSDGDVQYCSEKQSANSKEIEKIKKKYHMV